MNKKMFRSVSLYSLAAVLAVITLTVSAVILSTSRPGSKQPQTLTSTSASDLKVRGTQPASVPSISDNGIGNASASGTATLQAGQAAPAPAGMTYPCAKCPEARGASDMMVCADYCVNPEPEPTPMPPLSPYPQCNACRGATDGVSDSMVMCPMIACRYAE